MDRPVERDRPLHLVAHAEHRMLGLHGQKRERTHDVGPQRREAGIAQMAFEFDFGRAHLQIHAVARKQAVADLHARAQAVLAQRKGHVSRIAGSDHLDEGVVLRAAGDDGQQVVALLLLQIPAFVVRFHTRSSHGNCHGSSRNPPVAKASRRCTYPLP